jgi:predicted nucleic-acid-binding Zn-ribbon protein
MFEAGKCPKCGGENLNYSASKLYDTQIEYPFICEDCGFIGSEWYSLEFGGFIDENRNEVNDG